MPTPSRPSSPSPTPERSRALGVTGRSLFMFHGLYFHLVEAAEPIGPALAQARQRPDFQDVNSRLAAHIRPFDPQTWRGPADAMAQQFYRWTPDHS